MKYFLPLLMVLLTLTGLLTVPPQGGSTELISFSYSQSGMSADQIYTYTVRSSKGRYWADFELYCRYEIDDVPLTLSDVQALEALIDQAGLRQWDGFSGVNAYMLDGQCFSLYADFSDGTTLHASGSNSFPAGYIDGREAMNRFFRELMERYHVWPEE